MLAARSWFSFTASLASHLYLEERRCGCKLGNLYTAGQPAIGDRESRPICRNWNGNSAPSSATSNESRQNGSSNGSAKAGVKPEGTAEQSPSGSELDQRIAALEETVGIKLYRWVLREYGHANQPYLVRDIQQKKKILDVLESATRGLRRMEAVLDRVPEQLVNALLAKLQAPPLNEIADMPTLVLVVQGLESIVNGSHPSAA